MKKESKSSSSHQKRRSSSNPKQLKVDLYKEKYSSEDMPKKIKRDHKRSKKEKRKLKNVMKMENKELENASQKPSRSASDKIPSVRMKVLKTVLYKNKYFPEEYLPEETKLVETILEKEKVNLNMSNVLNTEDEEEIADNIRKDLVRVEKQRIFSNTPPTKKKRVKKPVKAVEDVVPIDILQESKLKKVLLQLSTKEKPDKIKSKIEKCFMTKRAKQKYTWKTPSYLLDTIHECLKKRKWDLLTHLLLDLVHMSQPYYNILIKPLYAVCDAHHPVIRENGLQGKYKDIRKLGKIGNDTNIV